MNLKDIYRAVGLLKLRVVEVLRSKTDIKTLIKIYFFYLIRIRGEKSAGFDWWVHSQTS